jgi:succinate dehydrogenase/fumarate reductase flavoprotein subunit
MKTVLVIGSGISGLSCAISLAEKGIHVKLASPFPSERSQSVMAAGGINAVDASNTEDSVALHIEDTLRGGHDIAGEEAVTGLCEAAPSIIEQLERRGTVFTRNAEGRIVGMTTVCCFTIPTGRHATIEDVVVLPECQGTGLGRKLVEAALEHLRNTGKAYKVGLTSKPARVAANALYRKMGFKQKETNVYTLDI